MLTRLFHSMRDNPAVRWQIRRHAWPSLATSLTLAAALAAVTTGILLVSFSTSRGATSDVEIALLYTGLTLLVVVLVFVTIRAALLTARDLGSEKVQLLQLTGLSEIQFVQSYVVSTLYALRVPLIGVVGLAPAIWIVWAHLISAYELTQRCLMQSYACVDLERRLDAGQVFTLLVFLGIGLLILASVFYCAAALGVYVAVRLRSMMLSAGVALAILVALLVPYVYIAALLLRAVIDAMLRASGAGLIAMVVITLMLALVMLVLANWMIEDTHRRAWEAVTGTAWLDKPGEY